MSNNYCNYCKNKGAIDSNCSFCNTTKEGDMPTHFESKNKQVDNVNHPAHYERDGAMECIDEMIMIFGENVVKHFCLCNAWKYRYRAADKNGTEDIAKSDWYIRKYKELDNKITVTCPR